MAVTEMAATSPVTPEAAAQITLDERLCLALYTASRTMTARYRVALADLGLTFPQYLVMLLLWEESRVPVSRIGERLHLESSTLSPLLRRLEALDLVTRSRDASDERLVIIGLSRKGRRLKEKSDGVTLEVCRATGMSLPEITSMVGDLHELEARVHDSVVEATAGAGSTDRRTGG